MLEYFFLDIICSWKLTVRSWKTVRFSEQTMSADKSPSICLRQMEAIVYLWIWIEVYGLVIGGGGGILQFNGWYLCLLYCLFRESKAKLVPRVLPAFKEYRYVLTYRFSRSTDIQISMSSYCHYARRTVLLICLTFSFSCFVNRGDLADL